MNLPLFLKVRTGTIPCAHLNIHTKIEYYKKTTDMYERKKQMNIREAVREDLPELLAIYNEAIRTLTATFDLEEQTLEERQAWFEQHGEHYPLIIAEVDNQVAGYCSLSPYQPKAAYAYTAELSIYLSVKFRGKGIGTHLIKEILKRARQLKFHTVIAIITSGNDSSVRLHERLGFTCVGHLQEAGLKFGKWQDVSFYQLMIDENASQGSKNNA